MIDPQAPREQEARHEDAFATWRAGADRYAELWRSGSGRHRATRALAIILIAAAAIRLWNLGGLPPGLQFDEAHNAIDAARLLDGQAASWLFFTDNGGREPLATWLHAPMLALVGRAHPTWALRLVSALVGLATIAAVYGFVARLFEDRRLALLASAFLATSYWHLHFSRYGLRAILAPLWTTLAVWAWWSATQRRPAWALGRGASAPAPRAAQAGEARALAPVQQAGSRPVPLRQLADRWWIAAVACGAALAAAAYSHPTGRLLPLILVAHALYRLWADREDRSAQGQILGALALAGLVSLLLFLPLGLWFLRHPEWFLAHPGDVSLAAVAARDFQGSLPRALAHQALAVAGMFFVAGDPSTFHNLPGLPAFDPLTAILALAGLGIALGALFGRRREPRDRALLLALWLAVMLLPTLLSDRPPNFSRAIAGLPVIVLFPALGLRWLVAALDLRWRDAERLGLPEKARIGIMAGAVLWAGLWTSWHYFVRFARQTPQVYYSYDVEKQDAHAWLDAQAETAAVFLHPLWAEQATIAYLNRAGPIQSLDATESLVLPAGFPFPAGPGRTGLPGLSYRRLDSDGAEPVPEPRAVLIAFPAKEAEREAWAERFMAAFPSLGAPESIPDARGQPVLTVFRIPSDPVGADAGPGTEPRGKRAQPDPIGGLAPAIWDRARFGDIQLVGYTIGAARPGQPLPITFVWTRHGTEPIAGDWTLFVQLVGPEGQGWGQLDRQPAQGSWPTSRWQPEGIVIDRYSPQLSPEASGELEVRIGWYDLASGERLPVQHDARLDRALDEGTALGLRPIPIEAPPMDDSEPDDG